MPRSFSQQVMMIGDILPAVPLDKIRPQRWGIYAEYIMNEMGPLSYTFRYTKQPLIYLLMRGWSFLVYSECAGQNVGHRR